MDTVVFIATTFVLGAIANFVAAWGVERVRAWLIRKGYR